MENGCAGWGCPPNRKLAVFGQFLAGGGGSKGEGSSERFPAGTPTASREGRPLSFQSFRQPQPALSLHSFSFKRDPLRAPCASFPQEKLHSLVAAGLRPPATKGEC